MNRTIANNILRFLLLGASQVFIFRFIDWQLGGVNYLHVQLYPLFILLLPLRTAPSLVILLAFLLGLSVDIFYETLGINAAAAAFSAWLRPLVLRIVQPREGYNYTQSPTKAYLGDAWFFQYSAIFMAFHLFIYFAVEAFTFVYIVQIIAKTVVSWLGSMLFLLMLIYPFNPKS